MTPRYPLLYHNPIGYCHDCFVKKKGMLDAPALMLALIFRSAAVATHFSLSVAGQVPTIFLTVVMAFYSLDGHPDVTFVAIVILVMGTVGSS